jgi:hypothetical protein
VKGDLEDKFFMAWFVFCALLGLTAFAVGIWAVVSLVQWVTR